MKKKYNLTTPLMLSGLLVGSAFTLSGCLSSSSSSSDDTTGAQHDNQGVFAAGAPVNTPEELDQTIQAANQAIGEDGVERFLDELERAIFGGGVEAAAVEATEGDDHRSAFQDQLQQRAGRWGRGDAPEDRVSAASSEQSDCPGGGNIVITDDRTETDGMERWETTVEFNGCTATTDSWGEVVLNGSLEDTWEETWGDHGWTEDHDLRYDITGSAAGGDLVLSGRETWGLDSGNTTWAEYVRIPRLEFLAGDNYIGFLDIDLTWNEEEVEEAGDNRYPYEQHWSGRIGSSGMTGHIVLDTPKTVTGPDWDVCPTEGHMTIEGNGNAAVLFGMDTGISNADVTLEINNQLVDSWDDCGDFYDDFNLLEGIFFGHGL